MRIPNTFIPMTPAFRLGSSVLVLLVCVTAYGPAAYAATAKEASCSISVPKTLEAGKKIKVSWKTKSAKSTTFTSDRSNVALGLTGKVKNKGSKKITLPADTANVVYQVNMFAYNKDGKSTACSKTLVVSGSNPAPASAGTGTTVKGGTGPITVSGTAPVASTLEVYVAYPGQSINTDYKNVWANARFQVTPTVFLGTLLSFTNGVWNVRFDHGFPKGSRIFVFDAGTQTLLTTLTAS